MSIIILSASIEFETSLLLGHGFSCVSSVGSVHPNFSKQNRLLGMIIQSCLSAYNATPKRPEKISAPDSFRSNTYTYLEEIREYFTVHFPPLVRVRAK